MATNPNPAICLVATMQCDVGKPQLLPFMWILLKTKPPPKHPCRSGTTPHILMTLITERDNACHTTKTAQSEVSSLKMAQIQAWLSYPGHAWKL